MALTKNMQYDHPAYLAIHAASLGTVGAGSGAASQRWIAPFGVQLKAVNFTTVTSGTGAATDAKSLFIIRQGTATTTIALFTTTAAIYSTNVVQTNTMQAGDVVYLGKGTDATEVGAAGLEFIANAQANFTP